MGGQTIHDIMLVLSLYLCWEGNIMVVLSSLISKKREYHGGIVIIDKPINIMVMLSSLISRWECHGDLIIIDKPR
jgi:hypothetical protein